MTQTQKTVANMTAGKFDIIRSKSTGREFVVDGHSVHASGIVYLCVCLTDGRGAALFASDFDMVTRHPGNAAYDIGASELARKTTHAVAMENAA